MGRYPEIAQNVRAQAKPDGFEVILGALSMAS